MADPQWQSTDDHAPAAAQWQSTDDHAATWLDQLTDIPKGFWNNMVQSGQGIVAGAQAAYNTIRHPIDTAEGKTGITAVGNNLGASQDTVRQKAEAAFDRGDYAEGVRHVLNYLIPIIGPQIDASGDKAQQGKWGEATGEALSTGAQLAGPEALSGVRIPVLPRVVNPNPAEASAMSYLETEGVPVSAAARTGNSYVRGVQKMADTTPLGTVVALRAERATTEGLRDLSGRLSGQAYPTPVVPEQAGQAVQGSLAKTAAQHAQNAETSYNTFRQIEQQPSSLRNVQTGTKTVIGPNGQPQSVPVMEDVPMPVDITGIKAQLKPIYDDMQKWMEPAKRNASAGFQAVKSILDGPDAIPASQAEAGLGGLKQLAREGAGRNSGMAKFITPKLQDAIDQAVGSVDPHALMELQAGRVETAAQYGTKAVADQLRTEPVQAFGQMTYAKDAGVDLLRQVANEAPAELPKIGRAYLEDLFGKATAEAGFNRTQSVWQNWQNLGPETKKLLFQNPALIQNLDDFFLAAKKVAENPNPSGSGVVSWIAGQSALAVTHPATGIPYLIGAGAVSKMLHSPAGVRALTNGLKIPASAPAAAFTAGQLLKMAGNDVQPVTQLPAAAQSSDPSRQIGPLATAIAP